MMKNKLKNVAALLFGLFSMKNKKGLTREQVIVLIITLIFIVVALILMFGWADIGKGFLGGMTRRG
jgi:hypothetical protein